MMNSTDTAGDKSVTSSPDGAPPNGSLPPHGWELHPVPLAAELLEVEPGSGLTSGQAASRLSTNGPNALTQTEREPAWKLFVNQFRSFLIVILVGAAVLAGLVGDFKDTIVIAVVLLINATLGFVQEYRAESSLAALTAMLSPTARVRRDGQATIVPAETIVPGDIVLLEAGDRVPADGRLTVTAACEIDESALTGESAPVAKHTEALSAPADGEIAIGDRTNCAYMNTTVTRGRAELVITSTGMQTEIGRLAGLLAETHQGATPLQKQLDGLGKRLALVALVSVVVFFVLGMLRGQSLDDTLLSSVALAVAAIPEGLPAVVTVTLAIGVSQMAKRGAIVKRLASVETLGSTSVICSDKTGTLTLNQMTVRRVITTSAVNDELEALTPGALCNDGRVTETEKIGDPTETALLAAVRDRGVDPAELQAGLPRVAEVPFDSAIKVMVTFHDDGADDLLVAAKGAFDVLVPMCANATSALDADMESMGGEGMRVLALARGRATRADVAAAGDDVDALFALASGLELTALTGIVDPPRAEARDAIAIAHRAGIDVKMITGDHATTAAAIAEELGITGRAVTGADVEAMSPEELRSQVDEIGVFARVAPEHKLRIVDALQSNGHVVAMTGDGVNDAPALKKADVGVAMGITGTEVSKEAASMVLTDDNFSTIVDAVERGRTIYDNIVTFVRFQLSTNLGAISSLVGAQIVGLPVPFTAIQVLWVNLIMDGPPAMTMGVDPPKADTMLRGPRSGSDSILTAKRLGVLMINGLVMAIGTLGVLAFYDNADRGGRQHALAMAFTTFVLFQLFNALCARAEERTVFHRDTFTNRKLWIALGAVLALQVAAVHVNFVQDIFGTADLKAVDWLVAVGVASMVLWVDEIRKLIRNMAIRRSNDQVGAALTV